MIIIKLNTRLKSVILLFFLLITGAISAGTRLQEFVYLHTDRNTYIAGETVYYKLYVLDQSKVLSNNSKAGYILLRNSESASIVKLRVKLENGLANGQFMIPDTLISGNYQLSAFTSLMKNTDSGLISHSDITIINRFDKSFDFKPLKTFLSDSIKTLNNVVIPEIKLQKNRFNPREKVILNLENITFNGNVSVSIAEVSPLNGNYYSISQLFSNEHYAGSEAKNTVYYPAETKGKILQAKISDINTGNAVSNAVVVLSCIDTTANLQYAVSNNAGIVQFLLSDYYNEKELFLTLMKTDERKNQKITIIDEFKINNTRISDVRPESPQKYKDYILKSQNIVYINKSYQNDKTLINNTNNNIIISPVFYHCEPTRIYPADYEPLNNFFEIAVELLPQVRLQKNNNEFIALMYNNTLQIYEPGEPAIFLDGVFVDDINKIMDLNSEQIKKIELLTESRIFGDLIFGGVISITSNSKAMIHSKPASYSVRLWNDKEYISENHATLEQDIISKTYLPYFKQLLYWNPALELKKMQQQEIVFYTSDNAADYIIRIEGITDNGKPISATGKFQVTDKLTETNQ